MAMTHITAIACVSSNHLVLVKFNSLVISATAITFSPDIADLAKKYN